VFIFLLHICILQSVADVIIKMSPNEVGDLHLDIAEAYMNKGIYKKARSLLSSLVKTANYNLVSVIKIYNICLERVIISS
jgi:general transcription factor 3C polypeptide 3 (transcription factor C subunit 4)